LNLLFYSQDVNLTVSAETALTGQGVQLRPARDFQEVANLLENSFITMLVLDFSLYLDKSRALLEHIQTQYPDMPVIGLYSSPDQPDLTPGKRISLPLVPQEFAAVVMTEVNGMKAGGVVSNASPPLFTQLMEMEERTCLLRMFEKKTNKGGILMLKSGRLVDARFNRIRAMDAACRILAWEEVDVFIQNGDFASEDHIQKDLQSIIMASAHMKDEGEVGQEVGIGGASLSAGPSLAEQIASAFQQKMGARNPIENISQDGTEIALLNAAQALGTLFGYGPLKLGFTEGEGIAKFHIPGFPPTTTTLKGQYPRDESIQLVSEILDKKQ
jgi:hypothetical protein